MQFSHIIQLFETNPQAVGDFYDAIITLDKNLNITFWNYGAELTFGYNKYEVLNENFENVISPNHFDIKITAITSELVDDQEWRGEIIHKKKDGNLICCVVSISKIRRKDDVHEYLLISRDISDRKELENLQRLNLVLEEQLNSNKLELANFFERINDGFFSFDNEWKFTHVNKKAAAFLGKDPSFLLGKDLRKELPAVQSSAFSRLYTRAMQSQQYVHAEEYSDALDRWFHIDVYPANGGLSVFFRDISEEKKAERRIRDSEELYRKIVETAQEGIVMMNEHERITFVNNAMAKMLGYDRQEMLGRDFSDFLHEDSKQIVERYVKRTKPDITKNKDIALLTKTQDEKWVILNASPIFKNDAYAGILAMVMDISERKKKEEELNESHQQLRDLASRLQDIREEERASMAREIHDELGQQLTALKLDIYWLHKNLPKGDTRINEKVEGILNLVNETLPKIEKKAIELHPSLLLDLGLLAAIKWQNKQFESRNEAIINFTTHGTDESLTTDIAIALYRIYQEALTNVARHAHATVITTTFRQNKDSIELMISDDGRGFNSSNLDKKKSLGLLSMKERCIVIGGRCEITSQPSKGTEVLVRVPFPENKRQKV